MRAGQGLADHDGVGEAVRDAGEGNASAEAVEQTTAIVRNIGNQASAASGAVYQQSARAGEYVTRNVNQYPLPALLIAGAIGYLTAYLMHTARNRVI